MFSLIRFQLIPLFITWRTDMRINFPFFRTAGTTVLSDRIHREPAPFQQGPQSLPHQQSQQHPFTGQLAQQQQQQQHQQPQQHHYPLQQPQQQQQQQQYQRRFYDDAAPVSLDSLPAPWTADGDAGRRDVGLSRKLSMYGTLPRYRIFNYRAQQQTVVIQGTDSFLSASSYPNLSSSLISWRFFLFCLVTDKKDSVWDNYSSLWKFDTIHRNGCALSVTSRSDERDQLRSGKCLNFTKNLNFKDHPNDFERTDCFSMKKHHSHSPNSRRVLCLTTMVNG